MIRKGLVVSVALATAALVTFAGETDASACGGCFGPPPPPTETPTVVTDHRMILTISKDKSTLYDQIRYTGSPSSFAWVLPIAGTVDVGLSANVVFTALDQFTQTRIVAPPLNCPQQPSSCNAFNNPSASAGGRSADESGVEVLKEEVVGPYQTVQLKVTKDDGSPADPEVLNKWLAENGYTVGDDIKPVIAKYVSEQFNFLALKLIPGKGVQDMRPVRVTTTGAGAVLPLRMVAAGTGPTVGITLWVVSEGRYEPQNFPSFYIKTDELVWDWSKQQSNYVDLRAQKTAAANGRAWETENSQIVYRQNVESVVANGGFGGRGGFADDQQAASDYLPKEDEQGNILKTAAQMRQEDMDTLFYGIPTATSRVTRIRADLSRAALDQDLQMTASADQEILSNVRQVTRELNQPQCPVWDGCTQAGTAPRDEAFARSSSNDSSCATTPVHATGPRWLATGGGLVGLAFIHAMRRRRLVKK